MTYKLDAGQQWLRDVSTNELVGIKDSVDGEERVIAFSETNSVSGLVIKTLWVGTQAQYDAIVTKDANTQYNTDVGIYIGYTLVSGGAGTTVPVVSASRELTKNDCVQPIRCDSASSIVLTINNDSTAGYAGTEVHVAYQAGTGAVSFTAGSGVTLRGSAPTAAQYATQGVMRVGANEWAYL